MMVVIAIVMMLAAIIMPILSHGREEGRLTTCTNNLHNIYIAWHNYSESWGGFTVPGWQGPPPAGLNSLVTWEDLLLPELGITPSGPFDENLPRQAGNLFCASSDVIKQQGPHATTSDQNEVYVTNYCYNGNAMAYDNQHYVHTKQLDRMPHRNMIMADGDGQGFFLTEDHLDADGGNCQVDYRHSDGANILFADGHNKHYPKEEARTLSPLRQ
jgi:prepilin-type processing-associated H-X9-DG protein